MVDCLFCPVLIVKSSAQIIVCVHVISLYPQGLQIMLDCLFCLTLFVKSKA